MSEHVRETERGVEPVGVRLPLRTPSPNEAQPSRHRSDGMVRAAFLGVVALLAYEQARVVWSVGRHLTNDDTGLLWDAAHEWARLRVHQPNFWGQAYGSTLEAVPVTLMHAIGMSYSLAMPVTFAVFAMLGWFLLAGAAWKRGHRVVALIAIAMPLVLSAYHTVFLTIGPPSTVGRFLVILSSAMFIGGTTRTATTAAVWTFLGLGVQLDPGSALLAFPVIAWLLFTRQWRRDDVRPLLFGAVVPAAYLVTHFVFYRAHPDYTFYDAFVGGAGVRPHVANLRTSTQNPGRVFRLFAPELFRSWVVPVVVLAALVTLLVLTRRRRFVVPAVLVAALVVYALGTPKAVTDQGPLLPSGRVFLVLPATMWFLLFLVAESGLLSKRSLLRPGIALVCLVVVGSTVVRVVDFQGREGNWLVRASVLRQSGRVGYEDATAVVDRCRNSARTADRANVQLMVFAFDTIAAYSCAAFTGDDSTLAPLFERRTWRLYDELHRSRSGMVVFGVSPTFCDVASQRTTCRFESGAAVLTFRRQPALPLLASLGIVPRVFGHNCVPVHASSTERLQSLAPVTCEHPADLRRSRIGPGPVDTPAAEAAVRRAFTDMLDVGDGNRSLPSVELGTGLPVARRLAGASGLAPPEVRRVDFVDEREAVVTFGSGTRLPTGEAVVQDGQWKVAQPTFCALLREKGLSCFS